MNLIDRGRKRSTIIAFAIFVTITSLITFIGSILYLEPIVRCMYLHRQGSYIGQGAQISFLETVVVNLRHCICIWIGLFLALIVGWRYAQTKFSGRLAVGILSVIAIVEIGYLLVSLLAALLQGSAA